MRCSQMLIRWTWQNSGLTTIEGGLPKVLVKYWSNLRHSFVNFHLGLNRNPGMTALIVSHRDQDCLYRHHLGIANQKDAGKYFEIRPRI